ncbi:hypothetical protein D3C77_259010 [compost metagenome]
MLPGHQHRLLRLGDEVGGHDLHPELVEHILDVAMKLGLDHGGEQVRLHPYLQLVFHIPVLQIELTHQGRLGLIEHGAAPGRQLQHGVHLTPGRIVADRHLGQQCDPLLPRQPRQVHHLAPHHHGIGQGHLVILACHQLGGEGIELAHHPLYLANLHQIAGPQGAGVDEHQAAHGMVHDARRPQGHHEAEEDADPLEGVGVGTGQIGVGHGQGKQPDHHREQPPGRAYGLGMQPLHAKLPPLDAIEENGQHTDEEASDDDDQHHCHQARHGRNHALQHVAAQGKQGVSQPLAPGPGLGEETEHIGEPAIGEHEDKQQGQQAEQADLHVARYLAPLMGDQSLLQQEAIGEPLPDSSMTPLQRPDEAEEDQTGQERQAASLDQIGGGVQLEVFEPHLVEPLADTLARLI